MTETDRTLSTLTAPRAPGLVLRAAPAAQECWLCFDSPIEVLVAREVSQVRPLLRQVEAAVKRGLYAAGFVGYEAAPAFDPNFVTRPAAGLPLVWFGLFERAVTTVASLRPGAPFTLSQWRPSLSQGRYRRAIASIRRSIERGNTYQVNYTFRLRSRFSGDAWSLFTRLWQAQHGRWAAFVDIGDQILCSASPELFFHLSGDRIVARPMKGTAPRGLTVEEDQGRAAQLERSVKNRAENLMIVDMVRNDVGRIARRGTVRVPHLFELEKYDSLYQLTSTVEAETDAGLEEVFSALFPCASITGAPKIRSMGIIRDLEEEPRGIYTGAIGWVAPSRKACFNVAIRTVQIDRTCGTAVYGTGGGIVWESNAEDEYRECRTKALVLTQTRPEFSLLETLRWEPEKNFVLLRRHLNRLNASARYFEFPCGRERIEQALVKRALRLALSPHRIRLLLHADGTFEIQAEPLRAGARRWLVALAREPIDRSNRFLYHKTTYRRLYECRRQQFPELDDVLLWNREGELTESTVANLVLEIDGELLTPPISCGLLPGTLRAELLAQGRIKERVLTRTALREADAVYLVNSLRGWIRTHLSDTRAPKVAGTAPYETRAAESP